MNVDLQPLAEWLTGTRLSMFVTGHAWVWPACESLHFLGLALLIGSVGLLDLRLLGFEKHSAFLPVNRFVLWGILGFFINLVTGLLFFVGNPAQYIHNIAFGWKVLFMLLAGVNVLVFYATGTYRRVGMLQPGEDAPLLAKVIAGTSLFLWFAVMYMGRMLPYIGNSF